MEVSMEKLKMMVVSTTNTSADISMNGEKLEEVTSFKYFGATLSNNDTSTVEVQNRFSRSSGPS
ncbi:hypothetical protein DPMN_158968 [Dreissena polymorpha]|uniref:Uncharacterized protein n=1 Tax=Dreissena polymorpha TaxID=45954 RepID=A0A9D4IRC7_DREPO|nr:hypothetical protein DPMN_158968 [Dreissena polymorpha]